MNEILVIELKIPWRYDLGWSTDEINRQRIKWAKNCIEEAPAIEATLLQAVTAGGIEKFNYDLL